MSDAESSPARNPHPPVRRASTDLHLPGATKAAHPQPSLLARLLTPVPPAEPRPSEIAYLHALHVVGYEGGVPTDAPERVQETIRRWRAWAAYDEAMSALRLPNPHLERNAGREADVARTPSAPAGPALPDSDWDLILHDLMPHLYARWDPIEVRQAGRPRHGTPHVEIRDGSRLSTHVTLWAEHHGHDYRWARRLLEKARVAGLIRRETHRTTYDRGRKVKVWSQWILLDREVYERRLAEIPPAFA
jgi:hypothetical protein